MSLFNWSDKFKIGIDSIDLQHQKLVEILNELHEAMLTEKTELIMGDTLNKMVTYTQEHFAFEEGLLRQAKYPELDTHKKAHEAFVAKATALSSRFSEKKQTLNVETWDFLKNWLKNHMLGEDKKYVAHLKSQGQ